MVGFLSAVISVLTSLKSLGFAGRVAYVAGLSIWTFLCLPTTPIELASGFIFPLWASTLMSVVGKTTGSLVALILGRRLLKPLVTRLLARSSGGGGAVHRHLVGELQRRPIQTMSILRAAPLPTPFKIYGLCLFHPDLVPVTTYFFVALGINTCWSLVWSLTGSSASSLQDAVAGNGDTSTAALVAKLFTLAAFSGAFLAFGRFAKAQLHQIGGDSSSASMAELGQSPPPSPRLAAAAGGVAAAANAAAAFRAVPPLPDGALHPAAIHLAAAAKPAAKPVRAPPAVGRTPPERSVSSRSRSSRSKSPAARVATSSGGSKRR